MAEAKQRRFGKMRERLGTIAENYRMAQRGHPTLTLELIGIVVAVLAVIGIPVSLFLNWLTGLLVSLPLALLAGTFWFSRRAMSAAYAQIEGQPGAAAAVAESLRGNWSVTPAVAVTRSQDIVSRAVSRCGIVLIGEGPASRIGPLLATERKKTGRWLPETPIYEIQVGTDEGQVPLRKLQSSMRKLPSTLRPAEVTAIRRRLDAVASSPLPVPKGPMPTSARQVRRPR